MSTSPSKPASGSVWWAATAPASPPLLKVLAGEVQADDGQIESTQNLMISRLEQEVPEDQDHSVHDMVAEGLGELGHAAQRARPTLSRALGDPDQAERMDENLARFETLNNEIEARGAWQLFQRVDTVLSKLNLNGEQNFAGPVRRHETPRAAGPVAGPGAGHPAAGRAHQPPWTWTRSAGWKPSSRATPPPWCSSPTTAPSSAPWRPRIIELDRGKLTSWPRRLRQVPGRQAGGAGKRRARQRRVRQEAQPGRALDPPGHQGAPHP